MVGRDNPRIHGNKRRLYRYLYDRTGESDMAKCCYSDYRVPFLVGSFRIRVRFPPTRSYRSCWIRWNPFLFADSRAAVRLPLVEPHIPWRESGTLNWRCHWIAGYRKGERTLKGFSYAIVSLLLVGMLSIPQSAVAQPQPQFVARR